MKKTLITFLAAFIYLFITNCEYQRIAMPDSQDTTQIFNTGEEKYIQMNPVWNEFSNPIDIFISQDDYIFLADSGNGRVTVLDKTGNIVTSDGSNNNFEALYNLSINPIGLCVDSKLNLFMTDRSNRIYVWNQFINNSSNAGDGNDSIATSIEYHHTENGDNVTITDFSESYELESEGYIINRVNYEYDQAKIDSILAVHVFYEDNLQMASQFISVAAAPAAENALYVTDRGEQNIHRISMVRSAYIKLSDGTTVWQHRGERNGQIATPGTGAGTVNDPTGIFTDPSGNVFYTQTGINFGFHKISEISEETQSWASMFTLGQHEILDLERFNNPADVAVDEDGNIFVLNTGDNEVQVFNAGGSFIRKAGLRSVQVDTTIMDTVNNEVVENDTIITKYYNDILDEPRGIFVDDGVIYVVNTGENSIVRFKLSSDVDVEIEE